MIYVILVLAVLDVVGTVYDVNLTVRGIRKSVGVEGNSTVTFLSGTDKPGYVFLYSWNLAWVAGVLVAALIMQNPASDGGAVAFFLVDAVKHLIGGHKWRVLLNGGTLPKDYTIWQKFLGLGD